MTHPNQEIINKFFEAYSKRDMDAIRQVMAEDATWTALGQHPLAGVKNGINEIIAFFDAMGGIMGKSNVKVEKLVIGANDNYLIECQHVWTNRDDGVNLDHHVCILWTFKNGKILSGMHFFADPQAADRFFSTISTRQ